MKGPILAVLLAALVSGCAMTNEQGGAFGGALAGGTLGALAGNALDCKGCALIGGLVGAFAGSQVGANIGRHMDRNDAARMHHAVNNSRTGHRTAWSNPDSGMSYDVTPTRTYRSQRTGDYCREVTIGEAKVGGKRQEVYGTACRKPDGSWEMQ